MKTQGTIHGLGFKDVETVKDASVAKIERSDRTHAHKIHCSCYGTESKRNG